MSGPIGVALTPDEADVVLRALRELVDHGDADSEVAIDVIQMLRGALPVRAMAIFAETLF